MEKLYNFNDVISATTLSKTTILKLVSDNKFPKPFRISGRRMAWNQEDVNAWIKQQTLRGQDDNATTNE